MTISVGDIVTVAQAGDLLWTVEAQLSGGLWHLTRAPGVTLDVDEADITVVTPVTAVPGVIPPGAMVTCRQTGLVLYAVCGRADDGQRWRLRGKRDDARGRSDVTGRTAGAGDLVLIRPTPTYSL